MKYLQKFKEFEINENIDINEGLLSDAYASVVNSFKNTYFSKLFNRLGLSIKAAYNVFINDGKQDVNLSDYDQWVKMMIYMTTKTKAANYITFIYDGKEYGKKIGDADPKTKDFYGIKESHFINEADAANPKKNVVKTESDDKEMPNITPDELLEVLEEHRLLKTSPFIWGAPGIGKTQIVLQYAKKTYGGTGKSAIIILNLALMAPEDFVGLPMASETGKDFVFDDGTTIKEKISFFAQPFFLPRTDGPENKGGLLFLDEYNRADTKILNASNSLILDGVMGTYKMPAKWFIVAAGNRAENYDRIPGIRKLGADQGSRFAHYNLMPTVEALLKFARSENGKMMYIKNFDEIEYLLREYSKANPSYTEKDIENFKNSSQLDTVMALHLKNNPTDLYTLGETDSVQLFASPRGWIVASVKLKVQQELSRAKGKELSIATVERILKSVLGETVVARITKNEMLRYVNEKVISLMFAGKLKDANRLPINIIYGNSETDVVLDNIHMFNDTFFESLKKYSEDAENKVWVDSIEKVMTIVDYFKYYVYQLDRVKGKFIRKGKDVVQYASEMTNLLNKIVEEFPRLKQDHKNQTFEGNTRDWSVTKQVIAQFNLIAKDNLPKDSDGNPTGNYIA